nr:hypothetical protein [uncultured Marvinbryantia sp.]
MGAPWFFPPWRLRIWAEKILLVACPFPVKNVTVSISRFYQFSITIALRFSAKKDNFRIGEKKNDCHGEALRRQG